MSLQIYPIIRELEVALDHGKNTIASRKSSEPRMEVIGFTRFSPHTYTSFLIHPCDVLVASDMFRKRMDE